MVGAGGGGGLPKAGMRVVTGLWVDAGLGTWGNAVGVGAGGE